MPTWRTRGHVFIFCVLAVTTMVTNKYVLSILKFTYPTIFQSWQTGTIALVLLTLHITGYIDLDLSISRSTLFTWFPAAVFFTGMIYSGSVALSRLPIPVFCSIHHVAFIWVTLADVFIHKKTVQLLAIISLIFTAISCLLITRSDIKSNHMGYKWMMLHCICKALYMYTDHNLKHLKLSELNKIFYNTSISIAILMAISVATGELYKVIEFPFLYTRAFHIGCLASGILGSILSIQKTVLSSMDYKFPMPVINSINRIVMSGVSLFIFESHFTVAMVLSIMVGLSSGVLYSFTTSDGETKKDTRIHIQIS